jgi:ABC-type uncharacterized transport system ATPase subunit
MEFSDWVTVLRSGEVEATLAIQETDKNELARLMVGREVLFRLEKSKCEPGQLALEVEELAATNDKGLPALKNVSLVVCQYEIVGIAGVAGNGQRELAEIITGLRQADGGHIRVLGADITNCSPRQAIEGGVSHIPGDRLGMGLVPDLSVSDNLAMKAYRKSPLSRGPLLNEKAVHRFSERLVKTFNIITPSIRTNTRLLSGGNQQKVILAREIDASSGVLVAVHPTRGLDVGATESVRKILLEERESGAAILLISEDLDELIHLSDRILVIFEGQIMGEVRAEDADREQIGLMMAGEHIDQIGTQPTAKNPGE